MDIILQKSLVFSFFILFFFKKTILKNNFIDFGLIPKQKFESFLKEKKLNSIDLSIDLLAPEVIDRLEFSVYSDIWSFGCLLYILFSYEEECLYSTKDRDQILDLIKEEKYPKPKLDWPDIIKKVICNCFKTIPHQRIPFDQIVENLAGIGVEQRIPFKPSNIHNIELEEKV